MKAGPLIAGLTLLVLAACFAQLLTQASCLTAYEQHARAVPVQAEVTAITKKTVRARENNRDVSYDVATLHLRAPWQGDSVRRTRGERLGHALPPPKVGETRRIYVDPQDPHADVAGVWPAWVFLWPAVASVASVLAGLYLLWVARRRQKDA